MADTIHYGVPETRSQIVAALESVNAQSTALWESFSDAAFFAAPDDGGWSPAQNVEHLIKSTAPVTRALGMPRLLLRLLFGVAHVPSRSFTEVRAAYRKTLDEGGQAGRFGPRGDATADTDAPARRKLLDTWRALIPRLIEAVRGWDEDALDRFRLPHPLLGKLTLREMLYFTLFHLGYHAEKVAARGKQGGSLPSVDGPAI